MISSPVGVLIIRVWTEGEPPSFRARITRTFDVEGSEQVVTTTADPEDLLAQTRRWLETFLEEGTTAPHIF